MIGLLDSLVFVDDDWKNSFRAQINMLELFYVDNLDDSIIKWEGNSKEDLTNTVIKLKEMVEFLLQKNINSQNTDKLKEAIQVESNWIICPDCDDAWETISEESVVACLKCEAIFRNPRFKAMQIFDIKSIDFERRELHLFKKSDPCPTSILGVKMHKRFYIYRDMVK